MSEIPKTKKPCPGCGREGWREKDKVCEGCAVKLGYSDTLI